MGCAVSAAAQAGMTPIPIAEMATATVAAPATASRVRLARCRVLLVIQVLP